MTPLRALLRSLQLRQRLKRWWHCYWHLHQMEDWYYEGYTVLWCHQCKRNFSLE